MYSLTADNFSDRIKTATGMRGDCCLNDLKYFHVTRNKIFDPMHDLLGGICPMIIKLVLQQYILVARTFNCKYLNGNISSFQWGYCAITNKPSANFTTESMLRRHDYSLSQKAMQIWCLIRALPFLQSEKIAGDDDFDKKSTANNGNSICSKTLPFSNALL